MKSPTPETQCAVDIYQMQYSICAVNFTNKISRSSWTWHNLWKLLIIRFREKYFDNSADWSGLCLEVYIPSWLPKISWFTVFRLLENAFVKLPSSYHDLIINPPRRTVPHNLPLICHEKLPSILYGARHYAFAPMENHVGVYPLIFGRKCRIKFADILNLAKGL